MEVLFILLPLALGFAAAAVGVFVWAARSGQFDDLSTPAIRALHDDDPWEPVRTNRSSDAQTP
jgi:cbb3-type cytochrome oxidase maturation protein